MAELIINTNKIKQNIKDLSKFFKEKNIEWSLITKVFSGDQEFLRNVLTEDVIENINSVGDSRLTSLKNLKSVNPNMRTIYIKPPAITYADEVIEYADISLNSSYKTTLALNEAAIKAEKIHKIIIMIELGELREGILREQILNFYEKVFQLSNIEVLGIGSNLGCMYGIEPTYDKLVQLCLYKQLIETKFNVTLPLVSGGTSITLPLLEKGSTPPEINHYRVGEAAFFGLSPLENKQFMNLNLDTFEFSANIIELEEKKIVPDGIISEANVGHAAEFENIDVNQTSQKAIIDIGMLDVDKEDLSTDDESISFVGVTSDMLVLDIGDNKKTNGEQKYHTGDKLPFGLNYMAVARLLNSKFIDKVYR